MDPHDAASPPDVDAREDSDARGRAGTEHRVTLELDLPPLDGGAVVHVVVEDVAEADAPAPELWRTDVQDLRVSADGTTRVEVDLPTFTAARQPALSVHVDRTGSGSLAVGDYINPAVVPLPAPGQDRCHVPLVEIG